MMTKEAYIKHYSKDDSPGWQSIDNALEQLYQNKAPRHFGPLCGIHYVVGGTDPIDGASIYDNTTQQLHRHIVSYGMSGLYYEPELANAEYSKWGFEFTMRLAPYKEDTNNPTWVISLMNNLARYVWKNNRWFEPNQYISLNGPIRLNTETKIVGLAFTLDTQLGSINTPHGKVDFIQMVGLTQPEIDKLNNIGTMDAVNSLLKDLKKDNPLLITDLERA